MKKSGLKSCNVQIQKPILISSLIMNPSKKLLAVCITNLGKYIITKHAEPYRNGSRFITDRFLRK